MVHWIRQTDLELSPAALPRHEAKWSESEGHEDRPDATASSAANGRDSGAALVSRGPAAWTSERATLRPTLGTSWTLGPSVPGLASHVSLPPSTIQASFDRGLLMMQGNFTIHVWNADVVFHESGGAVHRSGEWSEPVAQPSPAGAVRYRHLQVLRLEVTEGTLRLQTGGRPLQAASPEILVDGCWSGTFEAIDQEAAASSLPLAERRLRTWNGTDGLPQAELARPSSSSNALADLFSNSVGPPKVPAGLALVGGLLGLAALVLAHRHAQDVPSLSAVEAATIRGAQRSLRDARRYSQAHPEDPNAAFLLGTNLLLADDHPALLQTLEPVADALPREHRESLAFLLAVAAKHVGDSQRFGRWASEAARNPLLRRRMEREGVWPPSTPWQPPCVVPYIA